MGAIESAGIGAIQGKKDRKSEEKANRDLTRRMEGSKREYEALRPFNSAARRAAAQNTVGLYEPANAMLGEMMGRGPGQGPINLQQVTQRWPDPFNMQLAAQHAPPPQLAGPPAAGAPGWGSTTAKGTPQQHAVLGVAQRNRDLLGKR